MVQAKKEVRFSLKVVVNKQRTKVLLAEIDNHFADVLFSFLTLPLGRIVRILKKHYGDEAPSFGSLTSLYYGLSNLDSVHFPTEWTKSILLYPLSSSDELCTSLKVDISDSNPPVYYVCSSKNCACELKCDSVYFDNVRCCYPTKRQVAKKDTTLSDDGVLTMRTSSFLINDHLLIMSNSGALLQNLSVPVVTDIENAETMHITFGYAEVMDLLKASLISSTPLSDIILNKTGQIKKYSYSTTLSSQTVKESTDSSAKKMDLKLMVQKSTNKLLCAEAEKDFVEFLFGLLIIPLGAVEYLLENNSSLESIDNLYRSAADLNENKYFKNPDAKKRLINPQIYHGYFSENHIFPLTEECLPAEYKEFYLDESIKFPKGKGIYLEGARTYQIADDLTVTPYCFVSMLSSFNEMNILLSDVKVMELQIGLEEGLRILKASLTSKYALTDALLHNDLSNKQPKLEP